MKFNILLISALFLTFTVLGQSNSPSLDSKIYGLLIGSAIGDAAGGPVEFVNPPNRSYWCTTDKAVTSEGIDDLASRFEMIPYPKDAEPYAQFEPYAEAGTVTDDTRWKMILFNSLKDHGNYNAKSMATSYWDFHNTIDRKYDSICEIWQKEYGYVMNYYLDITPNYPPDRVWGGIPTMAGQMPYLPIAAIYPGHPEAAYLSCWNANIIDVGYAKDITSALVAGLSQALNPEATWEQVIQTMKDTDPFNFSEVPWVPRKSNLWIDKADELVIKSHGVISELFILLEEELDAVTWWEAHVPLCITLSFLKIVDYNPLAALQLSMEFGHDNDSYAQVIGAFAGAIYGSDIFDQNMIDQVNNTMKDQHNQDANDWMKIILNQ
jgi:hypothetical protein